VGIGGSTPRPELALLRESQDRVLEREGIPMVLALVSEVEPIPEPAQPSVRSDGERLAGSMEHFRTSLLNCSRDDDMGCLTTVLTVASYADFGRGGALL
jgi:hypothetical protein